jgi:hypothetical protein
MALRGVWLRGVLRRFLWPGCGGSAFFVVVARDVGTRSMTFPTSGDECLLVNCRLVNESNPRRFELDLTSAVPGGFALNQSEYR